MLEPELVVSTLEELTELLEDASLQLLAIEDSSGSTESLASLFRDLHTIKGLLGFLDARPLVQAVHVAEDLVGGLQRGEFTLRPGMVDEIFRMLDAVTSFVEDGGQLAEDCREKCLSVVAALEALAVLDGRSVVTSIDEDLVSAVRERTVAHDLAFEAVVDEIENAGAPAGVEDNLWRARWIPHRDCARAGRDPIGDLDALGDAVAWRAVGLARELEPGSLLDPYDVNLDIRVLLWGNRLELTRLLRQDGDAFDLAAGRMLTAPRLDADAGPDPRRPVGTPREAAQLLLEGVAAHLQAFPEATGRGSSATAILSRVLGVLGVDVDPVTLSDSELRVLVSGLVEGVVGDSEPPMPPVEDLATDAENVVPLPVAPARSEPPAPAPARAPARSEPPAPVRGEAPARTEAPAARKTLKVDQARIDRLMDFVGELIVAKNGLPYLALRAEDEFDCRPLSRAIKAQHSVMNRIIEDMQDAVMHLRMVPLSLAFSRFPRLVRDTAQKVQKDIRLVMEGDDPETDKNIAEQLGEPLVHLVRNACDHGLETPDEREAAGKPRTGTVVLRASQVEDHVIVEVIDDGRGLDQERIREKAVSKGMLSASAAATATSAQLMRLILEPGFSTRAEVSELSGRGVGMDVVNTMVRSLGGRIELESVAGRGTTVRIILPISMAVSRLMLFEVSGVRYGVPLSQVVQTLRLGPDDVQRLGGREVTLVREDLVPLLRLREAFQSHGESQGSRFGEAVLVVEVAQGLVGLVVDAFHEGIEAVVKPLTGLMATLPYVSGTTLLGDGQVLLVLDLEDLSHAHHLHADHRAPATDDQRRGGGAAAAVAGGAS